MAEAVGSVTFSLPLAKDTSRLAFVAATTVVIHVVQLPGNELHTLDLRPRSFGLRTVDAQHFFCPFETIWPWWPSVSSHAACASATLGPAVCNQDGRVGITGCQ